MLQAIDILFSHYKNSENLRGGLNGYPALVFAKLSHLQYRKKA